jgi:predicted DsbA family dithiol-disulfide isomerase
MIVEIFSDVVCPWCYIGKRRFERALAQFTSDHPDAVIDVRYRAFMLDPTAPAGVSQPVREAYARKFGGDEAADAIISRVTTEAAGEHLEFRLDRALRSNTLLAHQLLVLAEHRGCQVELKERLLAAYFTDGLAIGDPDVLVGLAAEVGLDPEECRRWLDGPEGRQQVADDLDFAADKGITGVPTYIFDGQVAIPGAQESELFVRVLERTLALSLPGGSDES